MSKLTKTQSFALIIVIAALIIAMLTAVFWNYTQDDVFITYTYSRNITEGYGFVFNPGERVQGTTTPLYTLLIAGVYLLVPDLLHAGNLLSALFLILACGLAVSVVWEELSIYGRLAAAITLAASPIMYVSFGMETLFYCALLMLAFWLWKQGHRWLAMAVAAALTWTRADGVVLGGTLWLVAAYEAWWASKGKSLSIRLAQMPWRLAIIYVLGILPWFGFAWAYFGTPLPNTLSAKQEILQGIKFWVDGFGWWQTFYGNNLVSLAAIPLIILGLWRAMLSPALHPLALWPVFFVAGYTILNVTAFWYYAPVVAVMIILAALGGEWLARSLIHYRFNRLATVSGAMALVSMSTILAIVSALPYGSPPPRVETYRLVGQWINEHSASRSSVLVGDLGIMGYYARRRTLDTPGLVVSKLPHWRDGYTIAKYRPDYIVATQYYAWTDLVSQDWFLYQYLPVAQLSTPQDVMSPISLYRRRFQLAVPQNAIQGFDLPLICPVDLTQGQVLPKETQARLLSSQGKVVTEVSHPFLWGQYPDSQATQNETLFEHIALPLNVPPGDYQWEVDCVDTLHGGVVVVPADQADGYVRITDAVWDGFAKLAGVALPEGTEAWSGGTLIVMLQWETINMPSLDYSVFLHLRDVNGQVVAQADGYPRGDSQPTTSWKVGDTIIDVRSIQIPSTTPEGDYQLWVGWYDWRTGDRLMLSDNRSAMELPVNVHNQWPGGSGLP